MLFLTVTLTNANGAFEFLFNVCQFHDQQETLPGYFEPLTPDIRVNYKFGRDTYLPSDHVRELQVNDDDS